MTSQWALALAGREVWLPHGACTHPELAFREGRSGIHTWPLCLGLSCGPSLPTPAEIHQLLPDFWVCHTTAILASSSLILRAWGSSPGRGQAEEGAGRGGGWVWEGGRQGRGAGRGRGAGFLLCPSDPKQERHESCPWGLAGSEGGRLEGPPTLLTRCIQHPYPGCGEGPRRVTGSPAVPIVGLAGADGVCVRNNRTPGGQ